MPQRSIKLTESEQLKLLAGEIPPTLIRKVETAMKPRSSRYGRNKGAAYQVIIAEWLSRLIGVPYIKGDDDSLIAPRNSGGNGVDIILRGDAKKIFPYSIECKNQENMNLVSTVEQAISNQADGADWLVIHKRKAFKESIVIMSIGAFERLWTKKTN